MTLAAHEDKTYRGGYIASPTMPWAWGTGLENPSGAYHLVWARDPYEIATALLAAGDRAGAERALTYLFDRQQKPDGSFPQNSTVDGTPHWTNLQLDEVADPILLAWQLGRTDSATYTQHVKKGGRLHRQLPVRAVHAAGALGEPERLLTRDHRGRGRRADLRRRHRPPTTATSDIGDSGPTGVDQRKVVDPSFLELVRLGVKPPTDRTIRNTISVVNDQLAAGHPDGGYFWHRFNFDGYGEAKQGGRWDIGFQPNPTENWATNTTIGRNWPIFGGERGEYELSLGSAGSAQTRLGEMAAAANDGHMLPEQAWAPDFPPAGQPGFPPGEGTFSATPLAWSHAQFVRLAWSIQAGQPVERPSVVACRYAGCS